MKEILYIQAGTQANYIGTHFWNTQESYFTYGDEEEDPETSHGISFREGLNLKGEPTFCPRLLMFDFKNKFGTLSQNSALFGMDNSADDQILWSGRSVEYRQESVRKSAYQLHLDDESEIDSPDPEDTPSTIQAEDVRYWSDFNRVFYVPRSVQKIPDIADWEEAEGNWTSGHETFTRYDEDTELMEGPLRLFLEECETIQGVQLMHDTSTFGSFVDSFLTSLRDNFLKLPVLAWPLLSDAVVIMHNGPRMRTIVNDALVLRSLGELSSMSLPIQSPTSWADEVCSNALIDGRRTHAFHTSAILAAHIETATLPLRLRTPKDDILSFCAQLDWRNSVPFAELRGAFPHVMAADLGIQLYNFSSLNSRPGGSSFSRRDVTRGFSPQCITSYDEWSTGTGIDSSIVSCTHAEAYPLPTSFPAFFKSTEILPPGRSGILTRPGSISLFSSVGATAGTANLFLTYTKFLEDCVRRKSSIHETGIEIDEMADLVNDLWTLHDNAGGAADASSDTDEHGEDED
ncbi:Misato segment II tubulin-like domain-containing protein [Mycena rebaudengoi]|nr:Misato segment II tubulin-like domain-containing protein [Mycena rebaudengoi]